MLATLGKCFLVDKRVPRAYGQSFWIDSGYVERVQIESSKFSYYLNKIVSDDVTLDSVKFAAQKFKDRTLLLFGLSVELSNTLVL